MTGKLRVASLIDLPTIATQGVPDVDIAGRFAVVAPAKLPRARVNRLHYGFVPAFADPEVKTTMAKQDNQINPSSPEAAVALFKAEQELYLRLVKKADIKLVCNGAPS